MTLFRCATSHLQRRDSSSYLKADQVKYIRKLTYKVGYITINDDHLVSPILLNFLPTISRLNCLSITTLPLYTFSHLINWNWLDSSLTSAFLHLMHLPTINHIDLSFIENFPLSGLTPSVNLLRLDILCLACFDLLEDDGSPEILVEMMPKIREFHTSVSSLLTTKLLHAKRQDGRPAFNVIDLRRLSIFYLGFEDERNIRYLLQNAKLLEKLHLSVSYGSLVGLLSLSARAVKSLRLSVSLWDESVFLGGICEELEAMAGHNILEALSFEVRVDVDDDTEEFVGSIIQKVENVLIKPGWSGLRQISFKLSISYVRNKRNLGETLQSLPDKYLSHLSKLESVAFNYSAYIV